MSYLVCPRCHASFHAGTIYEAPDRCPRCGVPFDEQRGGTRFKGVFRRRDVTEPPDWEAITGQQYVTRGVTRIKADRQDGKRREPDYVPPEES
jgi:hypothetical protein